MTSTYTKATSSLLVFAAIVGLSACGKKAPKTAPQPTPAPTPNHAPAPPPAPKVPQYNQQNTQSGCIGAANNNSTFVSFGGSYDIVREQYLPSYQCLYGNVKVATAVTIGRISIPAKSYAWNELYDKVTAAMSDCCVIQSQAGIGIWASLNYHSIDAFYTTGRIGGLTVSQSVVTFDRILQSGPMTSNFDNILALFTSLNSQYYYYASRYNSSMYYYGPQPRSGTSMFGGLSYSSGGGLNISLGGSFNR